MTRWADPRPSAFQAGSLGTPNLIPAEEILALILDLIRAAWRRVRSRDDISAKSTEPEIAGALYVELWNEKEFRGIDGPPRPVNEAAERRSELSLRPDGFIDFLLIFDWSRNGYFGMECKRVAASESSLIRHYATKGIARFVEERYCAGHPSAGMLGFVVSGDVPACATALRDDITRRDEELRLIEGWCPESSYGGGSDLFRTRHKVGAGLRLFHLLLPFAD